jgi:hypothetical protein
VKTERQENSFKAKAEVQVEADELQSCNAAAVIHADHANAMRSHEMRKPMRGARRK